ncbi:MAG: hypothetical protein ACYTFK_03030 [Planctomycetota bacterium]|jgi:hypothetical protein
MSRNVLTWALTGIVGLSILLSAGCGPQADLALKFEVGDRTKYKITEENIKGFDFEQPSLNKARSEPRSMNTQITFIQNIESVDSKGNAIAKIAIKGLKYYVVDKKDVKFDYDSSREADKKKTLSKLINKNYKIKLMADGSVRVVDAKKIRNAVRGDGSSAKVAKTIFSDKNIRRRHEIQSLPDLDNRLLSQGDSWSKVQESPYRLMVPKTFEKTYTLKEVKGQDSKQLAFVEMNGAESPTGSKGISSMSGGMGVFSNLFDSEETYAGEMVLDLNSGKVAKYSEKLVAKYVAAEQSAKQKADKGPDVLTIVLTYATTLEMLD